MSYENNTFRAGQWFDISTLLCGRTWITFCLSLLLWMAGFTASMAQNPTLPASPTACDYNTAPANFTLTAQNVPSGISTVYLLVNMTSGIIAQVNATAPTFSTVPEGDYYAVAAHYDGVLSNAVSGSMISAVVSSAQCLTYGPALSLRVCPAIASCDYATAPASITFTANSVPGGVTTSYVLVNRATNLIVQVSSTASFSGVAVGEYAVTSIHYTGSLTALTAGNRLYDVATENENCLSVSNTIYIKVCNSPIAISGPANGTTIASLNPPITGTATPGSTVTVTAPNGQSCVTVAATPSGSWICTSLTFTNGPQSVTATDGTTSAVSNFTIVAPCVATSTSISTGTVCGTLIPVVTGGAGSLTYTWGGPTMAITTATKDATHPYFGTGSSMGFVIDGKQGRELTLVRGVTYSFNINTPGHPFVFTTSPIGGGANTGQVIAAGVTNSGATSGTMTFTPTVATPNLIYYNCNVHPNMGWKVNVIDPQANGVLVNAMAGLYSLTVTGTGSCSSTAVATLTACAPTIVINGPANGTTVAGLNPPITGTATPGSTVTITGGPGSTGGPCIVTASGSGTYVCTSLTFAAGPVSVTAQTSDNGVPSSPVMSNFTVTGPPNLTVAQLVQGPLTQTVSGTATPGSVLAITNPAGQTVCSTTATASGTFSCGPISLTAGVNNLTVTACNAGGCVSQPTELTALNPPAVAILTPANNGTATSTPTISGTATPFASVTVSGPNGQICSVTATATGSWSCNSMTFATGANAIQAVASNPGGTSPQDLSAFNVIAPPSLTAATPPTGSTAQVISGTATPGSTIVITGPGPNAGPPVTLCTTTASISGTFACPVTVPAGPSTLTVTATNSAGSVSQVVPVSAVAAPTVAIDSPANNTTQPAGVNTVSGTATAGSTVTLLASNGSSVTALASPTGTYTATFPGSFLAGSNSVTAITSNLGGTSSPVLTNFTVAGAPSLTVALPVPGPLTQTVSGTATPGSTIVITNPAGQTLCTTVATSGTFSCPVSFTTGGVYPLTATASGPGGTVAQPTTLTALAPPTVAINTPADNTTQPAGVNVVSGTATAGSTVTLTASNGNSVTALASPTGGYTATMPTAFTAGTNSVTAITSNAGGISTPTVSTFTVVAPPSLTVAQPAVGPLTQTVSGTATPGSVLVITNPAGQTVCNTTVTVSGTFSCGPISLTAGVTNLTVTACNAGGCMSQPTALTALAPPTVAILSPADNTTQPVGVNVVSGTATPGSTVTLTASNGNSVTALAMGTGSYTATFPGSFSSGPNTVTATVSNAGGTATAASTLTVVQPIALTVAQPVVGPLTQPVAGTATPGSTVVITGPTGATLCTTTASASGTFSCPVTLTVGVTPVTVTASGPGGTIAQGVSLTALNPPTVTILSPVTGGTATTTPTISGTATPLASVTVQGPNGQTCSVTATATGSWSCNSMTFAVGANVITATASDPGGTSPQAIAPFNVIGLPSLTVATPPTGTTAPVISGTATPGSAIVITGPGPVTLCTTTASISGTFACTVAVPVGPSTLTVTAAGPAGSVSQPVTVSAIAPPAVGIDSPANNSTQPAGVNTVSGTATAGSTVTLTASNGSSVTTLVSPTGTYTATFPSSFAAGPNSVTAIAGNLGGPSSPAVTNFTVAGPTSLTVAPPVPGPLTQTVSGTATPGSVIAITNPLGQTVCSTTATASGSFTCGPISLATGPNPLTVTASGPGGSVLQPVTLMGVAQPTVAINTPANNSTQPAGVNTVSGTATPGSTVTLAASNGSSVTALASPTGGYTATFPGSFAAGPNTLTAVAGNAGGTSTAAVTNFTVAGPPSLTVTSPVNVSTSTTPTIAGVATPGSVITITGPNPVGPGTVTLCATTASASGTYSCGPLATLPTGLNTLTVTASGPGGVISTPIGFTTVPPPTIAILSPANNSTQPVGTQIVSGTATPHSTVVLTTSNGNSATITMGSSNTYSVNFTSFPSGSNTVTATVSNVGGMATTTSTFTVVGPISLAVAQPVVGPLTQPVAGTATPGSQIVITGPTGATLCTTTASASGTFSCPVTLTVGVTPVTVTASGPGGTTAQTVSLTALNPPTVAILSPATGGTAITTPTVSGTTTPLASVTVQGPNGQTCSVTATATGGWSCNSMTFTPGPNVVVATASDPGGTSPQAITPFTVIGLPSLTVATPPTGTTAPVISGTATPGSQVVITGPGPVTLCTTQASISGTFACPVTVPVGPSTLTVTATNSAGSVSQPVTVSAVAPPTVAIVSPANNGTATNTPTVSGTATPLASVTVLGPNGQSCLTTASASGTYACASLTFAAGPASVTAIAGNIGGASSPAVANFTAIAPPTLTVTAPVNVSTGTTPTVSGTATPGSAIVITGPGSLTLCTTTTSASGTFSCALSTTLPAGPNTLTVTASNPAGMVSNPTTFTVVPAPPSLLVNPLGPNNTTTPTVSGTATPGSPIVITGPNPSGPGTVTLCTTTASASGTYSCPVTVPAGPTTLTVTATGPGGSTSVPIGFNAISPPTIAILSPANNATITTTPTISGTTSPNSTVQIFGNNNTLLCFTSSDFLGNYSCGVNLPVGVNTITAFASTTNGTAQAQITVTVIAPPTVAILSPSNNSTQPVGTNVVSGTATPGSTVILTASNGNSATITMGSSNTYAVTMPTAFPSGANSVTATASLSSITATAAISTFTVVASTSLTVAPIGPAVPTTPLVSGTATPGSPIAITMPNPNGPGTLTLCTTSASASGTFACPVTLPPGSTTLTVTATGPGGTTSVPVPLTVLTGPFVSILSPALNSTVTGATQTMGGLATPFATVTLTVVPNVFGPATSVTALANGSGVWSVNNANFAVGIYSATAVVSNGVGSASATTVFTVVAPPVVAIVSPVLNSTTTALPSIVGTATPLATVSLVSSSGASTTVLADANGFWVVNSFSYTPGTYSLTAIATNQYGVSAPANTTFVVPGAPVSGIGIPVRVMLQGALTWRQFGAAPAYMRDDLRRLNLIPHTEPFTALGNAPVGGGSGMSILNPSTVLAVTGSNAIVDWVMVELRSTTAPYAVVASRPALLQADGDVVGMDGVSTVLFSQSGLAGGTYQVAVDHRNHVGAMTQNPITLTGVIPVVDFVNPATPIFKLPASNLLSMTTTMATERGFRCLWAGDTNSDEAVIFQGGNNDVTPIFFDILGDPSNTGFLANYVKTNAYLNSDVDMDGQVIFQGGNNEVDIIFFEIVTHPENVNILTNFIIWGQIF